jgi:hypothetical protein
MLSGPLKERLAQLKTLKEEEEKRNAASPATEVPSEAEAAGKNDWTQYGYVTDCSRIELSCPVHMKLYGLYVYIPTNNFAHYFQPRVS